MPLLLVALLIDFGLFFFVKRRVVLNLPPVFFELVAGHDWDVGEHGLDLGVPVLALRIGFGVLLRLLPLALENFFSLLALLEHLRQLALIALVEGLLHSNLLHRLWNLPQSVMHLTRPEGLENHGLAQAALISSFFLLIPASLILVVVDEAVVALGHDAYPIVCVLVARNMLIELTLVELYEAVRPEQTFLLIFLSLLVPLLNGVLFQSALVIRFVFDQLLVGVVSMPASILIQLPVLVLGAESAVRHVVIGRVLRVVLLLLLILNLHVHAILMIVLLAFGV